MESDATTKDSRGHELFSKLSLVKLVLVTLIAGMLSSVAIALILSVWSRTTIVARADGDAADGILYYPPKPYFIVYPRQDGLREIRTQDVGWRDLEFDRIYLPDLSQPQRLSVTSSLADLKLGFTLNDGWMLTSVSVDSQSVADRVALTSGSLFNNVRQLADAARQQGEQERLARQESAVEQEVLRHVAAVGFALLELVKTDRGLSLRVLPMDVSSSLAAGSGTPKAPSR